MKILIINGPNLNLVGKRDPSIYGSEDFSTYLTGLSSELMNDIIDCVQSNHEGEIVDFLHYNGFGKYDGIIINPGAYSHYSYAIADAIGAIDTPVVEIHISNIFGRDEFRRTTVTGAQCIGVIAGLGLKGYKLAIEYFRK